MNKTFRIILRTASTLSFIIALIFAGAAAMALLDRVQNGRGIMFADAEFLFIAAIIFTAAGLLLIKLSKKIKSSSEKSN